MLPPLDQVFGNQQQGITLGLDPSVFQPITEEESRLHAHAEEDEDEEEDEVCAVTTSSILGGRPLSAQFLGTSASSSGNSSPWPQQIEGSNVWQNLPVTMGDCKLTDSNSSLRLSPLLQHMSRLQTSPIPFCSSGAGGTVNSTATTTTASNWESPQQQPVPIETPNTQVSQQKPSSPSQENMDTSGTD